MLNGSLFGSLHILIVVVYLLLHICKIVLPASFRQKYRPILSVSSQLNLFHTKAPVVSEINYNVKKVIKIIFLNLICSIFWEHIF
jgi:hypothetical protein